MSVETDGSRLWAVEARAVGAGVVSGFVAGVAMGLMLQFGTGLLSVLGSFLGESSVLRGWIVHLVIAMGYGALFAAIVAYPWIQDFMTWFTLPEYVLVGVVYATMIAAVSIAILPFIFVLPWVTASAQPPYIGVPGSGYAGLVPAAVFGLAHLVYGAILGAVYAAIGDTPQ